ncbi:MFS general substrate transporter [Ascobolus immersus RN42]|uniref:MFS general substrate transporter n=1 Tax=Ascobolus immersus RN42 TaxID=1160509 RepID=A0A3N4I2N0_ASCIM|nr:MFS general substrate transporter [Ascobolus immersus RN42]
MSPLSPLSPSPPAPPGTMASTGISRQLRDTDTNSINSMQSEYEDPNLPRRRRAGGPLYAHVGRVGSGPKRLPSFTKLSDLRTVKVRRIYTQATYLVFLVMATISLLVFINSSISFIVTDLLGIHDKVGDIVGTLGFADEIVVIVAAPLWGMASDWVGERAISGLAMVLIGLGFASFTLLEEGMTYWWVGLLGARTIFALGAAAGTTMMSALIPVLAVQEAEPEPIIVADTDADAVPTKEPRKKDNTAGKHAGLVGLFSAFGALFALTVFLPLPSKLQSPEDVAGTGLRRAYYIVTAWALLAGSMCFVGIPSLPRKEPEGRTEADKTTPEWKIRLRTLSKAAGLGLEDRRIGLAYVGGFVARACAVGISLFIPLYVNGFFVQHGLCSSTSGGRKDCAQAYILASTLSGISQLFALLGAPVFGYLADRPWAVRTHLPLILAGFIGVVGYGAFGTFEMIRIVDKDGVRTAKLTGMAYIIGAVMGLSKIASIVSSLGLLGKAISGALDGPERPLHPDLQPGDGEEENDDALIEEEMNAAKPKNYLHIKGSISGVYSLTGGLGILLLTKVGGALFDERAGAPFWLLAGFNGVLGLMAVWTYFGGKIQGRIRL